MTDDSSDEYGNAAIGDKDDKNNKRQSVEEIARFRVNELTAFIYKYLRDRDLAEELAQESFARLVKRLKQPGVKDAGAYLFRTASNVVRDHFRRQKVNPVDPYADLETLQTRCHEPTPEEAMHCDDIQRAWQKALHELSNIQQEIYYLKRMERMSTLEIAARYNLAPRTVQRHLAVTFKFLHDTLN